MKLILGNILHVIALIIFQNNVNNINKLKYINISFI